MGQFLELLFSLLRKKVGFQKTGRVDYLCFWSSGFLGWLFSFFFFSLTRLLSRVLIRLLKGRYHRRPPRVPPQICAHLSWRKELRLPSVLTKRIATTLKNGSARNFFFVFIVVPPQAAKSPDEKNCDYPKTGRKELRLLGKTVPQGISFLFSSSFRLRRQKADARNQTFKS